MSSSKCEEFVKIARDSLEATGLVPVVFTTIKPSKFIAYDHDSTVTTWMGDRLGAHLATISYHKTRNSWMSDHKAYSIVLGDNGVFYSRLSFDSGLYCHLKAYSDKTQAKMRRRFAYSYSLLSAGDNSC